MDGRASFPYRSRCAIRSLVRFRFGHSRPIECAVCSQGIAPWSGSKRGPTGIESAPVHLPLRGTASRTSGASHAALTCRLQPSQRTRGRHAKRPFRSCSHPRPAPLCSRDETVFLKSVLTAWSCFELACRLALGVPEFKPPFWKNVNRALAKRSPPLKIDPTKPPWDDLDQLRQKRHPFAHVGAGGGRFPKKADAREEVFRPPDSELIR
jgi:hypothetical protein